MTTQTKNQKCETDGHLYCRNGRCIWCGDTNTPSPDVFVKTKPEEKQDEVKAL